ncbi:MAG: SDR family oxidoreductase [Sphingomonadaceae bacterium]|nr:SDR family oxidoreductase [Sphingomonadaceae bacterium]
MRLAGYHAVVTGGGTGIGAAIARALAAEGARLTLVGRRRERLEEVARELPGTAVAVGDVTLREQVDEAFAVARTAHGPISILVNNAGAADSAPFAKVSAEAWRSCMAVNLDALFHCCQAALPDLLRAQSGRIVTIASTAGLKGYGYTAPYGAAKHGAIGLTRALAAEFARTALTVNAICPGFTDTDVVADAIAKIRAKTGRSEEEALAELARFNPQQRLIEPREVAEALIWLCLPASKSITGQAIAVAGGEVM